MNKELIEKWISALRSGKYLQTTLALRDNYGFCCLGVFCDIVDNTLWETAPGGVYYYAYCMRSYAPGNKWKNVIPFIEQSILSEMNDGGSSFKEIADFIEEELNLYIETKVYDE